MAEQPFPKGQKCVIIHHATERNVVGEIVTCTEPIEFMPWAEPSWSGDRTWSLRTLALRVSYFEHAQVRLLEVQVTKQKEMEAPPCPERAIFGAERSLMFVDDGDAQYALDNGYWELDPEGMAMQFLRLAWVAAHEEVTSRNQPFDGDPRNWIQKIKDSDEGLFGHE